MTKKVFSDFYVVCMNGGVETRYKVSATSVKDAVKRFTDKYGFGCNIGQYTRVEDTDGNILSKRQKQLIYRPYYYDTVKLIEAVFAGMDKTSISRDMVAVLQICCSKLNKKYPKMDFIVGVEVKENEFDTGTTMTWKLDGRIPYELVDFQQKDCLTIIQNK
jgi:hypothetical protein